MLDKIFKNKINKNNKHYINSNEFYNAYLIKDFFISNEETIFVVLANLYEAQKYYDYLTTILEVDDVLFYPVDQILTTYMSLGSHEFQSERLYTINKLIAKQKQIVVTTIDGLLVRQLSVEKHLTNKLILKEKVTYNFNDVVSYLVNNGYTNTYTVEYPGTFSVRGGIVDVYLRTNEYPYRLDFFGDTLESIKLFDIESQRSITKTSEIVINPLFELFYNDDELNKALIKIKNHFNNPSTKEQQRLDDDLLKLKDRKHLNSLSIYIPFFNNEETTILDFVDKYRIFIIDEYKININEQQKTEDLLTFDSSMIGNLFSSINYYVNFKKQLSKGNYFIDNLNLSNYQNSFNLNVKSHDNYNKNLSLLKYDLENKYSNYSVYFNIVNKYNRKLLEEYIGNYQINYLNNNLIGTFILEEDKIVIFNDEVIFGNKNIIKANYRSILNQTTKVRNVDELNVGDYVVHYDYGIGKYIGLETMTLSGNTRDYLYIAYLDNEFLYVPVEQINLVLKYSSNDGVVPKLTKMGSSSWSKTKASVKKKIKDLSDRLINLYALREKTSGYAFLKDSELQKEFENDFLFELTNDQKTSIEKIKKLMETPKPMDVLLIGDVGFGKTEVALRAAFKAVLSGKQVLYLVPTTVLARQHYYTFKDRFEKFGANVRLMSRFVTRRRQTETIDGLSKGLVDVVIGTHRLLSSDIKFSNLGLLIIDEEQRFGVMHKEKIKELKVDVDTLTLSATPIPRTLQMSMMGLKDLALIETPPKNRYPIQTYIIPREDALIKEAVRREIARGGQVFYLYNKVIDIENVVLKIQNLIPEAKIAFAHGQMNKVALENTIKDFIDHKYDCLVATTIIETGIDIPNTNTLIIHDADKLGLSQLYQIRGRVGRSDKIAYAYLMYEKNKSLTDEAYKRLKALEEFTELGSGYKISLKDLAIRGAGDILGSEQSGFVDSVGLEMYIQLLDEVINNKEELKAIEDENEIYSSRTVNKTYINEDSVRIEIHKKINKLNSSIELLDLKQELEDRFGKFSMELETYMYEKLFKRLLYKVGKNKIVNKETFFTITFDEESSNNIDGKKLFQVANTFENEVRLSYLHNKVSIKIDTKNDYKHWLLIGISFIEKYNNM